MKKKATSTKIVHDGSSLRMFLDLFVYLSYELFNFAVENCIKLSCFMGATD